MKTKLALSAVAAAIAVFSQGAFAQASQVHKRDVQACERRHVEGDLGPSPGV